MEGVKQYVMPEAPPENAYEIIRQMELGIAEAKTQDERVHRMDYAICVMGAWLSKEGYEYEDRIRIIEPDEEKLTKDFFNQYGPPLMNALVGFYAPEIDRRRMRILDRELKIEYSKVRSKVIKLFKEKYGTESPMMTQRK